jgi:hypothetical protein
MRQSKRTFSSQRSGRWRRISSGSVSAVKRMNSAMPRLRVFVAANESILLGDLPSEVTQRTLICPFLELLVRGSLLHKIENLNIMRSERVVFTDGGHMHLIVQLGISKRPCFSSGGGIRHLEQLFFGVTSRLFDPWSMRVIVLKRLLTNPTSLSVSVFHSATAIRWLQTRPLPLLVSIRLPLP